MYISITVLVHMRVRDEALRSKKDQGIFWLVAGLIPWAVDIVLRFAQGASITAITSVTLSDDKSLVTWELTMAKVHIYRAVQSYNYTTFSNDKNDVTWELNNHGEGAHLSS